MDCGWIVDGLITCSKGSGRHNISFDSFTDSEEETCVFTESGGEQTHQSRMNMRPSIHSLASLRSEDCEPSDKGYGSCAPHHIPCIKAGELAAILLTFFDRDLDENSGSAPEEGDSHDVGVPPCFNMKQFLMFIMCDP